MKLTIVNTNCNAGFQEDFRVHREGCKDIVKEVHRSRGNSWNVEAVDAKAAIADEVAEFAANEMGYTEDNFYVCGCCRS
jgi:hypothetical protein